MRESSPVWNLGIFSDRYSKQPQLQESLRLKGDSLGSAGIFLVVCLGRRCFTSSGADLSRHCTGDPEEEVHPRSADQRHHDCCGWQQPSMIYCDLGSQTKLMDHDPQVPAKQCGHDCVHHHLRDLV